jgi:Tectonin domain
MSRTNFRFAVCLMLICWTAAAVVPASAQTFLQIPGSLSYIAAGRNEVWGLQFPGGLIWRFNPSTQSFYRVSGSLSQVAVGGGTLLQPDQVWGVNGAGVFSFDLNNNAYTQHNPPGSTTYFSQIAVGKGAALDFTGCHPYEVWGLAASVPASSGLPYRYNYCTNEFVPILPPSSSTPLTHIATGGGDVWALDANAHIWHWVLVSNTEEWTRVGGGFGDTLQQITVGVNDVWGLDGYGTVYRYDPIYGTFVLNQNGDNVEGGYDVTRIAAGGDGVWTVVAGSDFIEFFNPSTQNLEKLEPFVFPWAQIAVGSGAGVWMLNSSNQIYNFIP